MCYIKKYWVLFLVIIGLLFITNVATAEERTYYTAGPAYPELVPEDLKTIDNLSVMWKDLPPLKDVIDRFQEYGPHAAASLFQRYKGLGSAIEIPLGTYKIEYIETYNGYYIFKVIGLI